MTGTPSPRALQRRLQRLRRDYDALKARFQEIGFICTGSLVERWTSCGKPTCRCSDPEQRHGPYYQLSWKEAGVTVSKRLPAEHARLYMEWIENRHQLEAVVDQMRSISAEAATALLNTATATPPDSPNRGISQ
jgi:hypothetical protein